MTLQTDSPTVPNPAATDPAAPSVARRLTSQRELSLLGILGVLLMLFSLLNGRFAAWSTISQILNDMSIVVIVGIGLGIVLMTRNIDVSIGSMVGVTAFFAARLSANHPGLGIPLVILASCGVGLVLGSINGLLVSTLKVPSIMVTLGTLYIYRGVDSMLAGSNQVTAESLSDAYKAVASWSPLGIPGMIVYASIIAAAAHIFIRYTFSGRSVLALGSNPKAAESMGIPYRRWVFLAFALSGVLCGFAGVLWGARYGTADSSVATGYEIVVLAAVVVGGVSVNGGIGSIGGIIVGAAVLSTISVGLALQNVSQFWLQAIQGAVILAAIVSDAIIRRRIEARGISA